MKIEKKLQKPNPTDYQFIDSARSMTSALSIFFNNLAEQIHKIRCKYGHNDKKFETCEIRYKDCNFSLEYTKFKNDLIEYNCLCCNKNFKKSLIKPKKKTF